MLAAKLLAIAITGAALSPCDGSGGVADSSAGSFRSDAANVPVVDDVSVPASATIDPLTGVAHIVGSISFHDDFGTVTGVNVLAHGTNGSVYRGPLGAASPQPLVFDLSSAGSHALDFNVFAQPGMTSAAVPRTIFVQ